MKSISFQSRSMCWLIAAACAAGCASEPDTDELASSISATATIENNIAVDGCAYRITIGRKQFAPDAASLTWIQDLLPHSGQITVDIDYLPTGQLGSIQCGWGQRQELPEISLKLE